MALPGTRSAAAGGALPWGWIALGTALLGSVAAVWFASGIPLVTAAFAGGLATLIVLGIALARLRPAPMQLALASPDWSVTVQAIERPDTAVAITDRANRLVCASSVYVAQFGEDSAPPGLALDKPSQEALMVRRKWTGWIVMMADAIGKPVQSAPGGAMITWSGALPPGGRTT